MKILEVKTEKRLIGDAGENAAAKFLRRRGYMILKRNFIGNNGSEIDIIARRPFSSRYHFIEVKARTGKGEYESRPAAAVTPEKQRKIICAAKTFLPEGNKKATYSFDVIEVYLIKDSKAEYSVKDIQHLENTFDLNTARKKDYY